MMFLVFGFSSPFSRSVVRMGSPGLRRRAPLQQRRALGGRGRGPRWCFTVEYRAVKLCYTGDVGCICQILYVNPVKIYQKIPNYRECTRYK